MNTMKFALIRKDIRGITANKQLLVAMISVPVALTVVMPSIFIMLLHFMPNGLRDFDAMLRMLPTEVQRSALLVLPVIFLVAGQFIGIILINIWILLGLGALLAAIAWILMNGSFQKISYESMLR